MKKVVLFSLILALGKGLAQEETFETIFGGDEPPKKVELGFNLGGNYSYLLTNNSFPTDANTFSGLGFNMGVLADFRINPWMSISPKAELAFNKAGVSFSSVDYPEDYRVFPVSLEIKNHFIFKLPYPKNRPYLLVGPNVRIGIFKENNNTAVFNYNRPDLAFDVGIGLESVFKHFNFAPELRYSYGLLNVNAHPQLNQLQFHNVSLVFNFKG